MFQKEGNATPVLFLNLVTEIAPSVSVSEADIDTGNTGASWDKWMSHTYDEQPRSPATPRSPEPECVTSLPLWGQAAVQSNNDLVDSNVTPSFGTHLTVNSCYHSDVRFSPIGSQAPIHRGKGHRKQKGSKGLLFRGKKVDKKLQSKRLKQLRIHQQEQRKLRKPGAHASGACTCNLSSCKYKRHRSLEDLTEVDEEFIDDVTNDVMDVDTA